MTMTGAVTRTVDFKRSTAGVLSFVGDGSHGFFKIIDGILSFAGGLTRTVRFKKSIAGTITSTGVLIRFARFKRTVAGVLNFAALARWLTLQYISGVLSFAGALTRKVMFKRNILGTMDFAGIASRTFLRAKRIVSGLLVLQGVALGIAAFVKKGLSRFGFNMIFK